MEQTLTFEVSPVARPKRQTNANAFFRSVDAFLCKKYARSLLYLLDHIDPGIRKRYGNATGTEFNIPHGQIVFKIVISNESLDITAPFVSLPVQNNIPLLYHIASLNANEMDLAKIVLTGNYLRFMYNCPAALANPYKIYGILKEICDVSDKYHHVFTSQFGAGTIHTPGNIPYSRETTDKIYGQIRSICGECLSAVESFVAENKYGPAWNIIASTMYKLAYIAQPQGALLDYLRHSISENYREDIPFAELIENGKEVIANIKNTPKGKLAESLYYPATFIPAKPVSDRNRIRRNFESMYHKASNAIQAGDYMECCLMVVYKFYEMYYSCDVPEDIDRLVTGAMQASSAKPWKEAAPILYGAMSDIMQGGLQQQTGHRETVCDNKLPEIFRQNSSALNDVTSFCKAAIKDMGIDPASVSAGNQAWLLQQGDLEIRLFVFQGSYLFCSAEIGTLPEKNTGPALTYLASAYTVPYRLGVEGDRIYMAYRVHISDIFSDYATDIKKNIEDMASKANEIKDKLHY